MRASTWVQPEAMHKPRVPPIPSLEGRAGASLAAGPSLGRRVGTLPEQELGGMESWEGNLTAASSPSAAGPVCSYPASHTLLAPTGSPPPVKHRLPRSQPHQQHEAGAAKDKSWERETWDESPGCRLCWWQSDWLLPCCYQLSTEIHNWCGNSTDPTMQRGSQDPLLQLHGSSHLQVCPSPGLW